MDRTVGGPLIPTVPQNVLNQETVLQAHLAKLPCVAPVD